MPFRSLITRLKSTRKPRNENQEPQEPHEDETVDDSAAPSQPTESEAEELSNQVEVREPKPARGLRKATVSNRRSSDQDDENQRGSTQSLEPGPTDYLYFGEGISAVEVSRSLSSRSQNRSTSHVSSTHQSTGSHSNLTVQSQSSTTNQSGRDNSGFLNTRMNTHTAAMGYSYLTYGGSLQYDYAGTQS
ncbi:hypothetical protein M426DRAFT_322176 [Hypoxylon sp. CI-4A]|nr:hypothetical protein M426DRAFT_322176 [Hypoxylon sp. CI-4A]